MSDESSDHDLLIRIAAQVDAVRDILEDRTRRIESLAEEMRGLRIDMGTADKQVAQQVVGIDHKQTLLMQKQDSLDDNQRNLGQRVRALETQTDRWRGQVALIGFVLVPATSVLTAVVSAVLGG